MTKSDISKKFAELRKIGALVYNFQSHKKMLGHCKGFSDIALIYKGYMWFIEIKMKATKDSLRSEQKIFKNAVNGLGYPVFYREVSEENYEDILKEILN